MSLSKTKILFTTAVILAGSAAFLGLTQKPSFGVQDRGDWNSVGQENISVTSTIWINNPSKIKFNYSDVKLQYRVLMNEIVLVKGTREGVKIDQGNQTKTINSTLLYDKIPDWWATHVRNSEVSKLRIPLSVKAGIGPVTVPFHTVAYRDRIDTDIIGMFDSTLKQVRGEYNYGTEIAGYSTGPVIEVVGGSAEWGQVTSKSTNILIDLRIRNPNSYPLPVPGLSGKIEMNQIALVEWSTSQAKLISSPEDNVIAPGETEELTFRVKMDNSKIDDWLASHIRRGERTEGTLNLKLAFEIQEQQITLPPGEGIRCNFSFRTAILEDQNSSSSFNGCNIGSSSSTNNSLDSNKDPQNDSSNNIIDDTVGEVIG
ncbi:hypothetical protein GKQ38_02270 [Candidatus Nanohaloarchaea archaeon]|nr:hypothetical protein GKQ38_02270 [Candidatus Nanohaloarchaea archaeon]